ncbi:MAG: hypothetical protein B6U87_02660 [Candidatus Aenigmarchaeota archaeon ex4484_52]|nr:MAG: hypothetical protein B6U87_02660 [Candidatus Aenigmarchaeota archaeon ex4484_52]
MNDFKIPDFSLTNLNISIVEIAGFLLIASVIATLLYESKKRIVNTSGDSMKPTIPNPGLVEADQNYYKNFQPRIGDIVCISFNPQWAQDLINTNIFYYENIWKLGKLNEKQREQIAKEIYNNSLVKGLACLEKRIRAVPFNKIEFRNGYLFIDGSNMHYKHNFFDIEQKQILRLTNNGIIPNNYFLALSDNADVKNGFLVDSRVFGLINFKQLLERTTKLLKKTDKGEIKIEKYFS